MKTKISDYLSEKPQDMADALRVLVELEKLYTLLNAPCPFHFYGTDGVHAILIDRCGNPKCKEWRDTQKEG